MADLKGKFKVGSRSKSIGAVLRRFAVPRIFVTLYYLSKFGAKISPHAEVELSSNLSFGKGCRVSSFSKFKCSEGPLQIGSRCGFGTGCFVSSGASGLVIGDNLVCGPNVVIMASSYNYGKRGMHLHDQGQQSKGTRIGNNVWIGAGAIILDGADIGDDSIVTAGSVVSRKFPAGSQLVGNPAKPMRGFFRADSAVSPQTKVPEKQYARE